MVFQDLENIFLRFIMRYILAHFCAEKEKVNKLFQTSY